VYPHVEAAKANRQGVADLTVSGADRLLRQSSDEDDDDTEGDVETVSPAAAPVSPTPQPPPTVTPITSTPASPELTNMLANTDADELAKAIADAAWAEDQVAKLIWLLGETKARPKTRRSQPAQASA
jgi:hypothetical protein